MTPRHITMMGGKWGREQRERDSGASEYDGNETGQELPFEEWSDELTVDDDERYPEKR